MNGGDVDVEPYLDSRNTKGYGTATQILKPRSSNCVGERNGPEMVGLCGSGGGMRKYIWYIDAEHPTIIPMYTRAYSIGHQVNSLLSESSLSACKTWMLL